MAMNFSGAGEQQEMGNGIPTIPKGSIVGMKIMIRAPKEDYKSELHPMVTKCKSGVLAVDVEYMVVGGKFDGKKWWDLLFLRSEWQKVKLTDGQAKMCNRGDAALKAILESNRGLDPATATEEQYNIEDFKDFQGLRIVGKVSYENPKPKPGDKWINNCTAKVLNASDPEYAGVRNGVEIITDAPIPVIPQAPGQGGGAGAVPEGGTSWGVQGGDQNTDVKQGDQQKDPASKEMKPNNSGAQQAGGTIPAWGQQK